MDAKQMIVEGQAIQLKDEAARNAIADEYDSTSTYSVGDYCIYGGVYYRCTTAVTTAESFDSTKWTATQVGDELLNIEADITQLNPSLTTKELTASDLISAGVFTVATCYGYLSGNVFTLVLLLRAASVATTSTSVLATIKNGYRPKNTLYIMVQDNNNKNTYIKIASDGKITADVPYTTSNNGLIIMTTTYVI